VDLAVHLTPFGGGPASEVAATPDMVVLAPVAGADWLHRVVVEIRGTRGTVVVHPTDPNTPINQLTVRPNGSATFTS